MIKNQGNNLVVLLVVTVNLVLSISNFRERGSHLGAMPFLSKAPSVKNFCAQSFLQIIARKPHKLFFDEQIYKSLSEPDFFKQAGIRGDERVSWIRTGEDNKNICRLISIDSKGSRYWRIELEEADKNPLIYRVVSLHENDLKEAWK